MTQTPEAPDKQDRRGGLGRLSDFSIRYPVSICMVLISFLLLGTVSMFKIPLVLFPNINEPQIHVFVPYPNATPEQVQETITRPLEETLSTIPRVNRISSWSSADQANISLSFDWGMDIDYLRSEVRARVEQARKDLPEDVDRILVRNFSTDDIPIIEGRIASGRDLRGAYDFLDLKIKKPLERVVGVAEVEIGGVEKKQIEIRLRLDDLKLYRVEIGSLFEKLDSANLNLSLGQVDDAGLRYGVITDGALASLSELRNFPINERGLRLSDVADVEFRDPPIDFGRHLNGEYAISLEIRKSSEANTVETVDRVMAEIDRLNTDPSLKGIEVLVWHNSGREIIKSLSGLLNAGLIGAILAVVVLFLFLRKLSATLAIAAAIPFSIVAAVGFLYLLGNTLNVLSMMGLMLSTGMLVDNAVVVLESIFRRLERGEERVTASRRGTREVLIAVLASTLTSVIIFVPLVFGQDTDVSVFLGHTGIAIIITLFCSLFISLTLIPLGVARFIRIRVTSVEPSRSSSPGPESRVMATYQRLLSRTLRHRALVAVVALVVLAASFYVLLNLSDSSPEAQEMRDLSIEYEFSENYHYAKIEAVYIEPVEEFLFAHKEEFKIRDVYSWYANNEGQTRLYFETDKLNPGELTELRKQIDEGLPVIPGAEIRLGRQEGGQSNNWMGVNIYGEDSVVLQELAGQARRLLLEKGGFNEVHTALDRGQQEVQVVIDREQAARYGLAPQDVAEVLGIVLRGQRIRGYRTAEGEVDIWVKLRDDDRENLGDLQSLAIGGDSEGRSILLNQVAGFNIVRTPGSIERENRRTFTGIFANYGGEKRDDGLEIIRGVMDELAYPQGYGWSFGFFTQRRDEEVQDFLFNIVLALFMVYFVMASLFESLSHPFAILFCVLFAAVGVAWFLLITGTPFNIMAWIGVLILIGIVVNNGIVLLDHVNNLRRAGMERTEAILLGCRDRFRPILMTASTTVVGLIPLAVGTTSLFELRYFPMARTVMGGLMVSTVLTLLLLPMIYTLMDDLGRALRRLWRRTGEPKTDPAFQAVIPE